MKSLSLAAAVLLSTITGQAEVTLAPLFQDHGILQRNTKVPVWGSASPGERITVSFAGQTITTKAGADGTWRVDLQPLEASSTPATLKVRGRNTIDVNDVLVGDVWLCSGQSNMAYTLGKAVNAEKEVAAASYPLIRQFKVEDAPHDSRQRTLPGIWEICSPATAARFTAAGYFFARDIHSATGVPIGLINSTVGGTPIESWMSAEALQSASALTAAEARWAEAGQQYQDALNKMKSQGGTEADLPQVVARLILPRRQPTTLFNGMIAPLLPAALRGVLWYQGEASSPRADEYNLLFETMIRQWRMEFEQPELPFIWAQLPNYKADPSGLNWAKLRAAQQATLTVPHTGQAITIDVGDNEDIHPANKQDVGHRLALIARAMVYDLPADRFPELLKISANGHTLQLTFTHTAGGLTTKDRPLGELEVAGADGKFHPATARIDGDALLVSSEAVPAPVTVRYAWKNAPTACLFNGAGLPVAPFTRSIDSDTL